MLIIYFFINIYIFFTIRVKLIQSARIGPASLVLMCLGRVKLVVEGCESVGFWEIISAPLQSAIRVISLTFFMATAVAIMMPGDNAVIGW